MALPPKDPPKDAPTIPPGKPKGPDTIPPAKPASAGALPPKSADSTIPPKPRDAPTIPPSRPKDAPLLEGPDTIPPKGGARQEQYLRLMTEQLTGWDNPRAMLERALREDQFFLLAQKIVALKPGAPDPASYEMLLRLKQEEESMLPPGGFLDLAESLGMMPKIDRWVLRYVLNWCAARLKSRGAQLPMMCVNLSTRALLSNSFLVAAREEFAAAGVPPRTICFEINERDVIEHRARAESFIAALKPAGCRFTLDAFGSVRVSFSHLEGLAFDFLKIDGIIVDGMLHGRLGPATVKAINIVCREVGIRTIAEFVESKETLDKLREIGVDYVQGFGVARPEPITKLP